MASDDAAVVQRVIAGETNDYRTLVERHQQAIYRFLFSLLGHRHEAEDVAQAVFLAAYSNLASFDARRAKFSTWLFTIARNRAINRLKRARVPVTGVSVAEPMDRYPPSDLIEEVETLQHIDRAVSALPLDQKTVFVLAEIERLSHAQIAEIEKIAIGTVKSRPSRAKTRLRSALKEFARGS